MDQSAPISPPRAPQRPHEIQSPHGARQDAYFWLRDDSRSSRKVRKFLRQHNAYAKYWLAQHGALDKALFREMKGRLVQEDQSVPFLKHGYWYYLRFERGKEHPIYARRAGSMAAPEQIVLDINALAAAHDFYQIGSVEVSPDSRWLAYCEDTIGRRNFSIRLKDLASGETLTEEIKNAESDLAWLNDSVSFIYVAKHPETLLGRYVKRHRRGRPAAEDDLLFDQTDTSFYTAVSKSKSERFVFIGMESTVSSEWRYASADDDSLRFETILPAERDHEYQVEHWRDEWIFRTNRGAQNFRLVRAPIANARDESAWAEVLSPSADRFVQDFDVFAEHIAISERSQGLSNIRIKSMPGEASDDGYLLEGDEPAYTMDLGFNVDFESHVLRYAYTSLKTPLSIYEHDLRTRKRTLLKRDRVRGRPRFRPEDYASEFFNVPAHDGAFIPVSLVYRKDTALNGTAPLLQYGYGAYGLSMDPSFSASRLSLLDRGFVFAIAHVRGGQELGRHWYDEGRLLNKRNSFLDFISVTRHLAAHGYADPARIFAMGGSAGGLLMGAVANLAPELYRGIVAQVPFVDVVTTMLDGDLPLTSNEYDEWGDPREARYYEYMLSYSPYDNVRAQHYPAMMVTSGLWDSQVQYFEPAKWVSRLQELKLDSNPLLLHVDMTAGHGGKSGRFERYREIAREYAFILAVNGQESPAG